MTQPNHASTDSRTQKPSWAFWAGVLLLLAGATVSGVVLSGDDSDPKPIDENAEPPRAESRPAIRLIPGQTFSFEVRTSARVSVEPPRESDRVRLELSEGDATTLAALSVTVGPEVNNGWDCEVVGIVFHSQQPDSFAERALSNLHVQRDGAISIPAEARHGGDPVVRQMAGMLDSMSYVNFANTGRKPVEEADSFGDYRATYTRLSGGRVRKLWAGYKELRNPDMRGVEDVDCRIDYDFAPEDNWVRALTGRTVMKLLPKSGPSAYLTSNIFITRVDSIDAQRQRILGRVAEATGAVAANTDGPVAPLPANWREAFDLMVSPGASNTEEERRIELLKQFLRADPQAAREYLDSIIGLELSGAITDSVALRMWSIYAELGTPESQRYLMEILQDANQPDPIRVHALIYSGRLDNPSDESMETLWSVRLRYRGGTSELDSLIDHTSLLSIGTLISSRRAMSDRNDTRHVERICQEVRILQDNHEREVALQALGNAVHPAALPTLEEFARHEQPVVQHAAIKALEYYPMELKLPIAQRLFEQLERYEARFEVVNAIASLGNDGVYDDKVLDWGMQCLRREPSAEVSAVLVLMMSKAEKGKFQRDIEGELKRIYASKPPLIMRKALIDVLGAENLR